MAATEHDGRSTRWDPHRKERRRTIIGAAIATIDEFGPDVLTAQIAERAGVPRTHVYRHFEGKDALDMAVAREISRQIGQTIRLGLEGGGSARNLIKVAIEAHLSFIEDHPNLYRFLARRAYTVDATGSASTDDAKAAFAAELSGLLTGYMALLDIHSDHAEQVMIGVVGMVDATGAWWVDHRDVARAELTERLTDQTWLLFETITRPLGIAVDPELELPPVQLGRRPEPAAPLT
jgi:AcrR family transcriptional regulator